LAGLAAAAGAAVVLLVWPTAGPVAAVLVLGAWFLDRSDGLLARRQQTATAWGAWLDANIDELTDVGLHVAVASVAARLTGSQWPWFLLIGFLAGKYLFLHGLHLEREQAGEAADSAAVGGGFDAPQGLLWRCYHLPGNADIRIHLLVVALLTGWLTVELALVAAYYNLRWTARYFLVARRLGGRS
jgi:phosphatidylglycerophosphate synthase